MVEAILERRPSLEGLQNVRAKTTLEVKRKNPKKSDECSFQGIGPLGEIQHISAKLAVFGTSCGEPQLCGINLSISQFINITIHIQMVSLNI